MSTIPHPSNNSFTHVPDELVELILYWAVYDGQEFRVCSFEYEDSTFKDTEFSRRHSHFAAKCLVVCHRFLRIGMPLLWKFVVVRSAYHLQCLAQQARLGGPFFPPNTIAISTRRLQLRLTGPYDPTHVLELLSCMPRLTIFVSNNALSANQPCHHDGPSSLGLELSKLPDLRRILFCSSDDPTCLCDIRMMLQTQANLASIRCERIGSPTTRVQTPPDYQSVGEDLRQISLGVTIAEGREMLADPGIERLLYELSVPAVSLPNLQKVHMLQYSASNTPFLRAHGGSLRELLYSTPPEPDAAADEESFLSLCPSLRVLIWVIAEWPYAGRRHTLPARHEGLTSLTIVYPERDPPSPETHDDVQHILESIENGTFPALRVVKLKPGGSSDPHLHTLTWFRARRRSLKRKGTHLRATSSVE